METNIDEKMNGDMTRSYLIQRLQQPTDSNSPFAFGGGLKNGGVSEQEMKELSKIFSFDYMGSAEFEFGAVPKILKKIRKNCSDFVANFMTVHWRMIKWGEETYIQGNSKVYYLCHKKQEKEVKRRIAGWAMNNNIINEPTKAHVSLNKSFVERNDYSYLGWLELDNGFFFFTDENMWKKTRQLFEIKEVKE